jgi:hypothetical protein
MLTASSIQQQLSGDALADFKRRDKEGETSVFVLESLVPALIHLHYVASISVDGSSASAMACGVDEKANHHSVRSSSSIGLKGAVTICWGKVLRANLALHTSNMPGHFMR